MTARRRSRVTRRRRALRFVLAVLSALLAFVVMTQATGLAGRMLSDGLLQRIEAQQGR